MGAGRELKMHDRSALVSVAVIVVGIVVSLLLSRSITQPDRKLAGVARAMERGERFEPARIASLIEAKARTSWPTWVHLELREKHPQVFLSLFPIPDLEQLDAR